MGDSDLLSKAEAAGKAVASALTFGVTRSHFTGLDDSTLQMPNTVSTAINTGEEVPRGTGNFVVTLAVAINTNAKDNTLVEHRADVATLKDAFMADDIETTLTGDGFTVFGVRDRRMGQSAREEKVFSDFIELDIVCCASDIS